MSFNFDVWSITKSIIALTITVFVWYNGKALINSFKPTVSEIPTEVLVQLEANKIMIKNLTSSNEEAKELINRLKSENGQQSTLLEYVIKDNKKKDSKLEEVGILIATLERTVEKLKTEADVAKVPATTGDSEEDARRDKLAYEMKKIYTKDAEGEDFLWAWAMYFPNEDPDKKWKTGTYPVEFHATVVESENENGTFDRAIEAHLENNTTNETKGKEFPVELTSVEWEKFEIKDKKFYWWNPRLGLGATFTSEGIAPKLDFSVISYGKTKRDMDWRFLTFGLGVYENEDDDNILVGSFEPFSWNIGNAVPMIENFFVGPIITYDTDSNVAYGIGASIPF